MSGRHDTVSPPRSRRTESETASERGRRFHPVPAVLSPTASEALTIGSVPAVLLVIHFLLQPVLAAWPRLGYVRYAAARTAPAHRIAPEPFVDYAWWWHELTRVTHVLIHDPSGYHAHVVGNVVLVGGAAWILLGLLTALGRRRWFVFVYWEVVVVAPIVGSYAFDLFGTTAHGYGASTVGYAFMGVLLVTGLLTLADHAQRRWSERVGPVDRSDTVDRRGDVGAIDPIVVVALLFVVAAVIAGDVLVSSPATPVHQAGVCFGVLVGAVLVPSLDRL